MEIFRRICVSYLITTSIISIFVYFLIYNNIHYMKKLERLREDVDEIAHIILRTPSIAKDSHQLSDVVDKMVQKRLGGIWDALHAIKKQLNGGYKCSKSNDTKVSVLEERVNYASESLGAKVLHVKAESMYYFNFMQSWLGIDFATNPPIRMLQSTIEAGNCFAYKGDKSDVTIQLAHEIFIGHIMLEHIDRKYSPTQETSSAPKDFQVWGINGELHEMYLGKFSFNNSPERPLQYFSVEEKSRIGYLRFQFESNHGHPNYTCIYRIAVYGQI